MAALGKIRKRGVTLVIVIGLGLFAFIAEEAFRSCEATKNQQRQQVGEVLGNKINVLTLLVLCSFTRTESLFSNEGEQAESDDNHQSHASFSDFS